MVAFIVQEVYLPSLWVDKRIYFCSWNSHCISGLQFKNEMCPSYILVMRLADENYSSHSSLWQTPWQTQMKFRGCFYGQYCRCCSEITFLCLKCAAIPWNMNDGRMVFREQNLRVHLILSSLRCFSADGQSFGMGCYPILISFPSQFVILESLDYWLLSTLGYGSIPL